MTRSQTTFDQRMHDVEKGRDSFRSQYLEIREINKDLQMNYKALQKQYNAQMSIMQDKLDKSKENHHEVLSNSFL